MKLKNKADAFTLSEALVALLISMLVISCMLSLYIYINGSVRQTTDNYKLNQEVVNVSFFLKQNFLKSEAVKIDDNQIEFQEQGRINTISITDTAIYLMHNGTFDSISFNGTVTDTAMTGNVLSQAIVKLNATTFPNHLVLSKKYNRDYLINHIQRHEHFTEPVTTE